jgi:hypothetical protein
MLAGKECKLEISCHRLELAYRLVTMHSWLGLCKIYDLSCMFE